MLVVSIAPPSPPTPSQPRSTQPAPHRQLSSSLHPMVMRSHNGIFKPLHFANLSHLSSLPIHQALFSHNEPRGYKSIAKNPKWLDAMTE